MSEKQVKRLRRLVRHSGMRVSNHGWRALKKSWRRGAENFNLGNEAIKLRRLSLMDNLRAMTPRQIRAALAQVREKSPEQGEAFEKMLKAMGKI